MVRENGIKTYFASDIAFVLNKRERGFEHLLYVWGADHHGYIARLRAGLIALGGPPECFEVRLVQFVTLFRGGEKAQMSTRSGEFVTLRALRAEVGNDAARLFYVMRSNDQHLDFDLELAKARSNDNPVYFIQYAHARVASVKRQMQERGFVHDAVARRVLAREAHRATGNQAHQRLGSYPRDRGIPRLAAGAARVGALPAGSGERLPHLLQRPSISGRGRGAARCAIEPRSRHPDGHSQRPASGGRFGARYDVVRRDGARLQDETQTARRRFLRVARRLCGLAAGSRLVRGGKFTSRTSARPLRRQAGRQAGQEEIPRRRPAEPTHQRAHPTIPGNPFAFRLVVARHLAGLHRIGRRNAHQMQAVANDRLGGEGEAQSRIAQRLVLDQKLVRAVVGVEVVRQIPQVMHQRVGGPLQGAVLHGLGIAREALDELDFLRLGEPRERGLGARRHHARSPVPASDASRSQPGHAHIGCNTPGCRWSGPWRARDRNPGAGHCCA